MDYNKELKNKTKYSLSEALKTLGVEDSLENKLSLLDRVVQLDIGYFARDDENKIYLGNFESPQTALTNLSKYIDFDIVEYEEDRHLHFESALCNGGSCFLVDEHISKLLKKFPNLYQSKKKLVKLIFKDKEIIFKGKTYKGSPAQVLVIKCLYEQYEKQADLWVSNKEISDYLKNKALKNEKYYNGDLSELIKKSRSELWMFYIGGGDKTFKFNIEVPIKSESNRGKKIKKTIV